ncbi:hypothetical protein V2I52_13175 [Brenneria sp. g21c3]|uniref:hypothetical protein n=1 Tax=Brenneria sp. g21c3 TaxID=3093893 RepID=UPI002EA7873A|nr:hypothetical protein [Brenneria sp. g21c3]
MPRVQIIACSPPTFPQFSPPSFSRKRESADGGLRFQWAIPAYCRGDDVVMAGMTW